MREVTVTAVMIPTGVNDATGAPISSPSLSGDGRFLAFATARRQFPTMSSRHSNVAKMATDLFDWIRDRGFPRATRFELLRAHFLTVPGFMKA